MAGYAAQSDDLEGQVDGFDDLIHAAKQEAFDSGRQAGMCLDLAQQIADLENELQAVKASYRRCGANLQAAYDWLRSDDCKTVKARQVFERRLLAALQATPRY